MMRACSGIALAGLTLSLATLPQAGSRSVAKRRARSRKLPEAFAGSKDAQPSSVIPEHGFFLSPDCEARVVTDGAGSPEALAQLVADCPAHCTARRQLAQTVADGDRRRKLAILSPHWNASADPLLSWSLAGLSAARRGACVSLAVDLADLLRAESLQAGHLLRAEEVPHLQRAMQYYRWVLEHQPAGRLREKVDDAFGAVYSDLANTALTSQDLSKLDFWQYSSPSWPKELEVQYLHSDPDVLVFDNVLTDEDCLEIAAWQDARHAQLPPSLLCFHDLQHAQQSLKLRSKDIWGASDMLDGVCFTEQASAGHLSTLGYVRKLGLGEGEGAGGKPFAEPLVEPFRKLNAFLEDRLGLPPSHAQHDNVALYNQSGSYAAHTDCLVASAGHKRERHGRNTERHVTALTYLAAMDGGGGGETSFPKLGVEIEPKCGRVLVFNNLDRNGQCDPNTIHEAKPVVAGAAGAKRIVQRWYSVQADPMGPLKPPPPRLAGHRPFQQHVLCSDEMTDLVGGRPPKMCRDEAAMPDFRHIP
jgi:hypothetical protein